jgi:phosphopantetheinyl transferase (holo-ACP synthase)
MSTGNDIIALQLINPERTKQKKFYSKILCKQEVELYNNNCADVLLFENFVWLAWSIKESVFKFQKRIFEKLVFPPTKIIISKIKLPSQILLNFTDSKEGISFNNKECFCCEVNFYSTTFYTKSFLCNDLIFTVANNADDFTNVRWGIKNIHINTYDEQTKAVRIFALNMLTKNFSNEDFSIEKSASGYPFLPQQKNIPLSFTHHGNFVAYSCCI